MHTCAHAYSQQVPKTVRDDWIRFMKQYFYEREALAVLFHLIDSRHGPVTTDLEIMTLLAGLPTRVNYVVVLTKADKRDTQSSQSTAAVRRALEESGCNIHTPIIYTSSVTKLGRDQMWRYLRQAADPDQYGVSG